MIFDGKKIYGYFIVLMIGLSLITYGLMSYAHQMRSFSRAISDEEVVERAKALGMVDVKEILNKEGD